VTHRHSPLEDSQPAENVREEPRTRRKLPTVSLVGVTGYGGLYVNHLLHLHDRDRIQLRDAVVVNPDQAASPLAKLDARGVRTYPDMDALCRERAADWICLPVGIPAHRDLTLRALEAGANILLEKPAAGSLDDWRTMREAEQRSGRRVFVGFQHLHNRTIRKLKHALVCGEWGEVRSLRVTGQWPRGDRYYGRNGWVGKKEVDGVAVNDSPLQNAFAHYLNLALFLAGDAYWSWAEATSVTGRLFQVRPDIDTFDNCDVRFRLANGLSVDVSLKHATRTHQEPVVRVETDLGPIEIDDAELRSEKQGKRGVEPVSSHPHGDMFLDVLVEEGFGCTLENAGHHTRAIQLVTDTLTPERVPHAERDPESGVWYVPAGA